MNRKTLILVCPQSVNESFVLFASLLGEIMSSIVIQFVHLVAPFTSLEKVAKYNRKVLC